jgi:hypothetical protein
VSDDVGDCPEAEELTVRPQAGAVSFVSSLDAELELEWRSR